MKAIILVVSFFCTVAHAGAFNLSDLKSIVDANKAYTVDQLLPLLPQQMRANPLLVYDSRALRLDRVNMKTPRIILFNEDASLIMAITKHPGDALIAAGEDSLEVIQLNEQTKKFEMLDLVFNGQESPFDRALEKNPKLCLTCHGANPRPVFNDYNAWPGFYGSFSTRGYAVKGTPEFSGLEMLLANVSNMPRYKDLDFSGFAQDDIGIRTTSRGMGDLHDSLKFSINLAFGAKLEAQMWRRLGAKLVSDANFRSIAPLFYMMGEETNRCGTARERAKFINKLLLATTSTPDRAGKLLTRMKAQIQADYDIVQEIMIKHNSVGGIMNEHADPRGILNIPYGNYKMNPRDHAPLDPDSFFALYMNMEAVFRHLGYDSTDLSTTPGRPSAGIFHLKRLGKLLIDEQFFQNLIGGIYEADPTFKATYDSFSCDLVSLLAQNAVKYISLPDPAQPGVLYK